MKTNFSTLIALGITGLVSAFAAQPVENNPPVPPPEAAAVAAGVSAAPGADNANGAPPDVGNAPLPPEVIAQIAAEIQQTNQSIGQPSEKNNSPRESTTIQPTKPLGATQARIQSNFVPPETAGTNSSNELRMNFKNAPLDMVLNYLSDAAGFIIVLDTTVRGNVNIISSQPVTKDEAVNLLNSVLNKNGYAAIRDGRTLTIVDKNDAKTRDIPVKSGNNPAEIPKNDEIVTQIIPVRFVEARQLVSDMSSFVSPQATVVANEAGNSIVVTDTQANIRHLAEIIRAIDNSAEAETEIRVFRLKFASPQDVATELTSIFPSSSSGAQSPTRFNGGGGGGPGGFFQRMMGGGGGGGNSSGGSNDRLKKATQVTAVADARIQAVIVTAPKDLMEQIAGMMTDLDVASTRDQKVFVFHLDNADSQQAAEVLQGMFQSTQSRNSGSSQNSALQQRAINNATTTSSSSSGSSSGSSSSGGNRSGGGRGF